MSGVGCCGIEWGIEAHEDWCPSIDAALAEAVAALPEGWDLLVGHTSECKLCAGWWATASKRQPPEYPLVVSSEHGRPRGEHHDATPAAALRALAAKLRTGS